MPISLDERMIGIGELKRQRERVQLRLPGKSGRSATAHCRPFTPQVALLRSGR